jgi:hypothetical protein
MPPLPNTPSWRGAQLKHRENFTFTLVMHSFFAKMGQPDVRWSVVIIIIVIIIIIIIIIIISSSSSSSSSNIILRVAIRR